MQNYVTANDNNMHTVKYKINILSYFRSQKFCKTSG